MSEVRSSVGSAQPSTEPETTASSSEIKPAFEVAAGTNGAAKPLAAVAADQANADDGSAFVARLTGAMQSIVSLERSRIANYTEERRRSHLDVIHERDTAGAEQLRTVATDETRAVEQWIAAEMTRIQQEGERRKRTVQDDLHTSLAAHRSTFDGVVEGVERAITAYRAEVDEYFARLDGVDDPVVIAQHAVKRPVFPTLPDVPEPIGFLGARVTPPEAAAREDGGSTVTRTAEADEFPAAAAGAPAQADPPEELGEPEPVDPAAVGTPAQVDEREELGEPEPDSSAGGPGGSPGLLLRTVAALRPMSKGVSRDQDAGDVVPAMSIEGDDGDCGECSSSRSRGAAFCFACGRELKKTATATTE